MKPGFFIDRPVFSTVLSILIVIVGIIGLALLPVDQYPQITPPVVKISATYPGASALTVSQAVATPIEQELNGTPGMIYMQSSSSNSGSLNITVTFDVSDDSGRDPDPWEPGRESFARRGDPEWYHDREAGTQPADDLELDVRRSEVRRDLSE